MRQKLLVLYAHSPDLNSRTVAWSAYDGTGQEKHTTGDSEEPPYESVVAAMRDGWRVTVSATVSGLSRDGIQHLIPAV